MAEPSQSDIFAALQAQGSFRSKNPIKTVIPTTTGEELKAELCNSEGGKRTNKRKLYCLREGCGSCILSPGAGEWFEHAVIVLPDDPQSPFPTSTSTPELSPKAYWYIPSSPFAFDNIGFSRPDHTFIIPPNTPGYKDGGKIKWLICAECDLGPLGWGFEGGTESWLAVDRVRYGV